MTGRDAYPRGLILLKAVTYSSSKDCKEKAAKRLVDGNDAPFSLPTICASSKIPPTISIAWLFPLFFLCLLPTLPFLLLSFYHYCGAFLLVVKLPQFQVSMLSHHGNHHQQGMPDPIRPEKPHPSPPPEPSLSTRPFFVSTRLFGAFILNEIQSTFSVLLFKFRNDSLKNFWVRNTQQTRVGCSFLSPQF